VGRMPQIIVNTCASHGAFYTEGDEPE